MRKALFILFMSIWREPHILVGQSGLINAKKGPLVSQSSLIMCTCEYLQFTLPALV